MKKVLTCVGTRPNIIKITQFERCFREYPGIDYQLLHTGQHYSAGLKDVLFEQLKLNKAAISLSTAGANEMETFTNTIREAHKVMQELKPDLVMVPGDVNSSFACAFAAYKCGIPIAHIESGLRSFDRTMPEELNRIMIDDLADLFFTTEDSAAINLAREGRDIQSIYFVGNTMIDTLIAYEDSIDQSVIDANLGLDSARPYVVCTFHRPANVDNREPLQALTEIILLLSGFTKVVLPMHPRTRKKLEEYELLEVLVKSDVLICEPLGYIDFIKLVKGAKMVVTDSGGIQEETTYLKVPCLTLRDSTERPVTCELGTNQLLTLDKSLIEQAFQDIMEGKYKQGQIPPLWDGQASARIAKVVAEYLR